MNPFELTKDPDGGGTTVRVKHGFVVLTREEEKQITERITEILTENARLRELVRKYGEYTDQDRCEGCACKSRCNDGDVGECWQLTEIRKLAREMGVKAR